EQYAQERLYAQETLTAPDVAAPDVAAPDLERGDQVVLVAAVDPPVVFGLGCAIDGARLRYTHRIMDEPLPADGLEHGGPLDAATFEALAAKIGAQHRVDADKRVYLVSLDLPIEARSPAEAVRGFWSYVRELGPRELPTFVAPAGDELAMRAFV